MARELKTDQKATVEDRPTMEHKPRAEHPDRSLGELLSDLSHETATLIQQEIALAKAEMSQKASRIGKGAVMIGVGGAFAFAGLLGILTALIAIMVQAGWSLWASALLIGGVTAVLGGILVGVGVAGLKHVDPVPRETLETLEEDKEWAKQQIK